MKCSQCTRPALYKYNGALLCVDHANIVAGLEQRSQANTASLLNFALDLADEVVPTPGHPSPRFVSPSPYKQHVTLGGNITNNYIGISESVIGVLNTGEMKNTANNINQNVSKLVSTGDVQVAEAVKHLAEQAAQNAEISDDQRKGLLEQLEFLSTQAELVPNKRQNNIIRPVYDALMLGFTTVGSLASVWSTWGAVLSRFFKL